MAASEELFNPFRPEFHADPYPFYHRLRSVEPVHQTSMGFWVLTRYDDVVMVLRDPRFGRDGFEHLLAAVYGDDREAGRRGRELGRARDGIGRRVLAAGEGRTRRTGRLLPPSSPRAPPPSTGRSVELADRRRRSGRQAERRGAARHLHPALHRGA